MPRTIRTCSQYTQYVSFPLGARIPDQQDHQGPNYNNEYVEYVSLSAAQAAQMLGSRNGGLYVGVDNTTLLNPSNATGRNSVKLVSNPTYDSGLFIADFAHMPGNSCGLWPAGGEIDIIEGVNMNADDQMTLHKDTGCTPSVGSGGQTGIAAPNAETDCGADNAVIGCGVVNPNGASYGSGFNAAGGGVYATLLSGSGIQIWMWNSGSVPGDITSGVPNPPGWGDPVANLGAGCNYWADFFNMQIVSLASPPLLIRFSLTRCRSSTLRSAAIGLAVFGLMQRRRVLLEWRPATALRWHRRAIHMLRRTQVPLTRRIGSSTRFKCTNSAGHLYFLNPLPRLHSTVSIMRKYTRRRRDRLI